MGPTSESWWFLCVFVCVQCDLLAGGSMCNRNEIDVRTVWNRIEIDVSLQSNRCETK